MQQIPTYIQYSCIFDIKFLNKQCSRSHLQQESALKKSIIFTDKHSKSIISFNKANIPKPPFITIKFKIITYTSTYILNITFLIYSKTN